MDDILLDHFRKLLTDACSPQEVRAVEAGGSVDAMWAAVQESGFLDALVPEADGGAGLGLADVAPLLLELGAYAVPLPVAETMVGRALLAKASVARPSGPIALADLTLSSSALVLFADTAAHVLADLGDRLALFGIAAFEATLPDPRGWPGARLRIRKDAVPTAELGRPRAGLRAIGAVVCAAQIAGAAGCALDMSVAYAGERVQFGKPIGKQQAVQQNLAVMAEHVVMAGMAAQIGCADGIDPTLEAAAVAKQVASAAAAEVADIAHAIHGAIGISEEYDLQLLTRRLHALRPAHGSEGWWAKTLGTVRLDHASTSSVDYIRAIGAA